MDEIYIEGYNNDNLINGWYYDLQLRNRLSSITLHANKRPKGCKVPTDTDSNWTKEDYESWKEAPGKEKWDNWTDGDDKKYGKAPLCTAILNEDFSVTAANNWSDFGSDVVGGLWGNVIQPLSPYSENIKEEIHKLAEKNKNIPDSSTDSWGGIGKNAVKHAVNFLDEKLQKGSIDDYLRSALVVQGTRFSYYNGTEVAFSNLGMKFTVFPKWNEGNFISVIDQLLVIYPYFIGHLVDSDAKENTFAKDFIKWQRPPGDFTPNLKQIDEGGTNDAVLDGTLKLNFGPYYSIRNLVGGDITLNFSKQMIKQPVDGEGSTKIKITPLYCDVTLTLKPATKYSDNSLRNFVGGKHNSSEITKVNNEINKNLNAIANKLNKNYK